MITTVRPYTWTRYAVLLLFLSLVGSAVLTPNNIAQASTTQTIAYTGGTYEPNNPSASRSLIYVNNPEKLIREDMADLIRNSSNQGPTILSVQGVDGGRYRDFFEHANGYGSPIGYGIFFYNNGSTTARLTIRGKGFVSGFNASTGQGGGTPFVQVFSNYNGSNFLQQNIAPGGTYWLRWDSVTGSFSGVVDFDIDFGKLLIRHVAYTNFAGLPGSYYSQGYVQRNDGQDQRRVYKGVSSRTAALASVSYSIDSADVNTYLPVSYQSYSGTKTGRSWISSIDQGNNPNGIGSDMASFTQPDAINPATGQPWVFSATTPDATGRISNLGNWGIVYKTTVTVTNNTNANRTVQMVLTPPPAIPGETHYVQFAYFSGSAWVSKNITIGSLAFPYYTSPTIAPGSSLTFSAYFVIGAPSYAHLTQSIFVK